MSDTSVYLFLFYLLLLADLIILLFCSSPLPLPHVQTSVGFVVMEFCLLSLLSLTSAHIVSQENLPNSFCVCVCMCVRVCAQPPPPLSSSLVLIHTHFPTHFNTNPPPYCSLSLSLSLSTGCLKHWCPLSLPTILSCPPLLHFIHTFSSRFIIAQPPNPSVCPLPKHTHTHRYTHTALHPLAPSLSASVNQQSLLSSRGLMCVCQWREQWKNWERQRGLNFCVAPVVFGVSEFCGSGQHSVCVCVCVWERERERESYLTTQCTD